MRMTTRSYAPLSTTFSHYANHGIYKFIAFIMDTEELQQVIVNQAVQIDKLTSKIDTYKRSNLTLSKDRLRHLVNIEVLQDMYFTHVKMEYMTKDQQCIEDNLRKEVQEEVDKRLREHYELNHGE